MCDNKKCFLGYLGKTATALHQTDHFTVAYFKYVFIYSSIQQIAIVCQDWKSLLVFSISLASGEWKPLRLCQAPGDAHLYKHGGSSRPDPHEALWAVPAPQAGGDGLHGRGPREPATQVSSQPTEEGWQGGWCLFICPGWRGNLPHHERPLNNDLLSRFLCCLNHWKASCSWRSPSPHPTQGVT